MNPAKDSDMLHDIDRLDNHMATVFNGDPGLSLLPDEKSPTTLSEQDKRVQEAWVYALLAIHGPGYVHAAYLAYREQRRQKEAANMPTLTSWGDVGHLSPSVGPPRLGDSPCRSCTRWRAFLAVQGVGEACVKCAQRLSAPHEASLLWTPFADHLLKEASVHAHKFVPGLAAPQGQKQPLLKLREAACLSGATGRQAFSRASLVPVQAATLKTPNGYLHQASAHVTAGRPVVFISGSFNYSNYSNDFGPAYGFRLATATLTVKGVTSTHTDIYDLLGAAFNALHRVP